MKSIIKLLILVLIPLFSGCCENTLLGSYPLPEETETLFPSYTEDQPMKWIDSKDVEYFGSVTNSPREPYTMSSECDREDYQIKKATININNEQYHITATSTKDPNFVSLEIYRIFEGGRKNFGGSFPLDGFTEVEFRGFKFKDVVVLRYSPTYYEQEESFIFYHKTKGIEFVYLENDKWYQRKE